MQSVVQVAKSLQDGSFCAFWLENKRQPCIRRYALENTILGLTAIDFLGYHGSGYPLVPKLQESYGHLLAQHTPPNYRISLCLLS